MQLTKSISVVVMMISITTTLCAQSPAAPNTKVYWQRAVQNYLKALHSDNPGVRQSAEDLLNNYRLKGAVSELILTLQNNNVEDSCMSAALTLILIGEKDGITAVQKASTSSGSERVANFCTQILNAAGKREELGAK